MASGFNFFTDEIDVTPGALGSWQDVDVSSHIPVGSEGAIVRADVGGGGTTRCAVRENGSTDDYPMGAAAWNAHRFMWVGVDENRVLECYITAGATHVKLYIVGYIDSNCPMRTNGPVVTPGVTGSWQDVDVSSYVPGDATGVIILIQRKTTGSGSAGIRKNGSSDTITYGLMSVSGGIFYGGFQLCGVDGSQIFECNIEDSNFDIVLMGYTKSPVTWLTDVQDISISQTWTWVDIDVTAYTSADCDGVIVLRAHNGAAGNKGALRENGSSSNPFTNGSLRETGARGSAGVGVDAGQILEGQISSTDFDFYLQGWCEPAVGEILKEVADVLGLSEALLRDKAFSLADALGLIDAATRDMVFAVADATGLSEAVLLPVVLKIIEDVSALSDDATLPVKAAIVSDALGLKDQALRDKVFEVLDSIDLTDAADRELAFLGIILIALSLRRRGASISLLRRGVELEVERMGVELEVVG
ncbi:MAG: hypothetical protein NWE79_08595 [Candidatus Bathyarchaeota archaeon]|nr:hypothetical protein [Candidatus Bathyarchaeota archaeon]